MSNSFYRAFEDRHRGPRELIKSRLSAYQPFLAPLPAVAHPAVALDLGCGRGEWLELLGELGFSARGVDLDEGMLAACRERGLNVATADALSSLRALPDASVALVSAFHLVEHIPFEDIQELIAQALRVLQPGGLLIMETPNPENLVVASTNFYTDPSHLRPVPPLLLDFAVEFAGFARHKVVRLQEQAVLRDAVRVELINVLNGVSPDYSVVGQKAADAPVLAAFDEAFAMPFGLELDELARRYEQHLQAREADAAAALSRLEERVAAAEQGPAQLFQRALETIGGAQAALLASQERESAQAEAVAQLGQQLQQARSAQADAEWRGQQAQQQLDATAARLQHAQNELDAVSSRARGAEETVAALHASTSWRITAPLRRIRRIGGARRRGQRAAPATVRSFAKRVFQWGIRKVLQHRRLTEFALGVLARHPGLKARLRRAAIPTTYATAEPSPTSSATPMTNQNHPHLPARAARLLSDMQKASTERKR
jgi:O-antigen chain-terminating methyltransferase